jgi:hypothetical protein
MKSAITLPKTEAEFQQAINDAYLAGKRRGDKEAFDVEAADFTLKARLELSALSYLMSQARMYSGMPQKAMQGLSWLLEDIADSLDPDTDDEKGGA